MPEEIKDKFSALDDFKKMERLEEILKTQIKPQILRYSYLPYQMNAAMEIFKKIGQKGAKITL